jgi:hypothetical protein
MSGLLFGMVLSVSTCLLLLLGFRKFIERLHVQVNSHVRDGKQFYYVCI